MSESLPRGSKQGPGSVTLPIHPDLSHSTHRDGSIGVRDGISDSLPTADRELRPQSFWAANCGSSSGNGLRKTKLRNLVRPTAHLVDGVSVRPPSGRTPTVQATSAFTKSLTGCGEPLPAGASMQPQVGTDTGHDHGKKVESGPTAASANIPVDQVHLQSGPTSTVDDGDDGRAVPFSHACGTMHSSSDGHHEDTTNGQHGIFTMEPCTGSISSKPTSALCLEPTPDINRSLAPIPIINFYDGISSSPNFTMTTTDPNFTYLLFMDYLMEYFSNDYFPKDYFTPYPTQTDNTYSVAGLGGHSPLSNNHLTQIIQPAELPT